MEHYFFIFAIIVISVIFIAGYSYAKKTAANYQQADEGKNVRMKKSFTFLPPGKKSIPDNHPLGAVQSTIRGRKRFVIFGAIMIAIGIFALHQLYLTDRALYFERTPLNNIIGTVLFLGAVLWGLNFFYYTTRKVVLREKGFEMSSIFGAKAYEYKDADFYLYETIEHKHQSDGYRPFLFFNRAGNYNFIWVCQIVFSDSKKPIIIKSSHYSWLHAKITPLINCLYEKPS